MRKGLFGGVLAATALMAGTAVEAVPTDAERVWEVRANEPGYAPRYFSKGVPPMAYRGGRGPIKRNKARRWHAKRLAKKGR